MHDVALIPIFTTDIRWSIAASSPKYATNSTVAILPSTSGYVKTGTGAQATASMCPVQAQGLAPIGDGPPSPEQYSTACSCNAIVSSVVTVAPTIVTGVRLFGSIVASATL